MKPVTRITVMVATLLLAIPAFTASPASASAVTSATVVTQVQTIAPALALAPTIGVRPCGWGVCSYFNRTDQVALRAGGSVLIAAGLCRLGVPCPFVGVVLAVGNVYLANHGFCPHYLWVRTPYFGFSYAWCT